MVHIFHLILFISVQKMCVTIVYCKGNVVYDTRAQNTCTRLPIKERLCHPDYQWSRLIDIFYKVRVTWFNLWSVLVHINFHTSRMLYVVYIKLYLRSYVFQSTFVQFRSYLRHRNCFRDGYSHCLLSSTEKFSVLGPSSRELVSSSVGCPSK